MFKKFLAITLILPVFQFAILSADWTDYKNGVELSKKEGKPMILYFYRDGCHYCEYMDSWVLSDQQVEDYINKTFIFAYLDMESEEGRPLANKYGVFASPSFVFLAADDKEKPAHTIVGSRQPEDFLKELQQICTKNFKEC